MALSWKHFQVVLTTYYNHCFLCGWKYCDLCFSHLSMHWNHLNNLVPDCWPIPLPHPWHDSVSLGWSLIICISVFPDDSDDGHSLRTYYVNYVIFYNIYFLWLGGSTYCVLKKNWADIGVKQITDNDYQISKCTYTQSEHPFEVNRVV